MMESFLDDETDTSGLFRQKRSFDAFLSGRHGQYFGNTRHNLLDDFNETPTKVLKTSKHQEDLRKSSKSSISYKTPVSDNSKVDSLLRQISELEGNVVTYKTEIVKLENKLANVETSARENLIKHDKELAKAKALSDKEVVKSNETQSKLQYVMEKEREARELIVNMNKEHSQQIIQMEKKLLVLKREKLEECDRAQQAKAQWLEEEMEFKRKIFTQESSITTLQLKCDELEALKALQKKSNADQWEHNSQVEELMKQIKEEQNKNKELSKKISEHEEAMIVTKALKADLDLFPSMKKEMEQLKQENEILQHNEQNALLLQEENRSLKSKLEAALVKCEKMVELEVNNEELEGRLNRWEAFDTSGSRRPQSPSSLSRKINELEVSQAMLISKQGGVETDLNCIKLKLEQSESKVAQVSLELSSEKNTVAHQNDLIKRLKRKLMLVSKERESYKEILDSYESEATMNVDSQKEARLRQLEEIVQSYQNHTAELETELKNLTEKLTASQSECEKLQLQLSQNLASNSQAQDSSQTKDSIRQLQEKIAVLENSLLKAQEEKDILEARIEQRCLQGDYDPSKVKVLHLLRNPCSIAQDEMREKVDKLTSENDRLRKRNELLEETGGQAVNLTMQVEEKLLLPSPTKELEEMKSKLKREETRNQRLTEVFKKTSQNFREICYQLTGYKIDIPHTNQYRLTNMYSASPTDYLWFKQNDDGEIQLLETDFSHTLRDAMELYLQQQNSIPVFLSSVTMDLFSRQTMNVPQ